MTEHTARLTDDLISYLSAINPQEHPVLTRLRTETARHRQGEMTIAHTQVQLLVWLAQLIKARFYLEIGVFTGHSSTAMGLALPENGHITTCDINVTYTDIARHYWQEAGVAGKIDLKLQPALITLDQLIAQGFANHYDLALIDADKLPTRHYFERCLTLIRSGGIIAIDNVLLQGRVAAARQQESESIQAMREFNASLRQDERIHILTLPLGDGLTLIQKK